MNEMKNKNKTDGDPATLNAATAAMQVITMMMMMMMMRLLL
jgi:hypothetical protein